MLLTFALISRPRRECNRFFSVLPARVTEFGLTIWPEGEKKRKKEKVKKKKSEHSIRIHCQLFIWVAVSQISEIKVLWSGRDKVLVMNLKERLKPPRVFVAEDNNQHQHLFVPYTRSVVDDHVQRIKFTDVRIEFRNVIRL